MNGSQKCMSIQTDFLRGVHVMKRVLALITLSILLLFLSYRSGSDKQRFYGTYTFEKVSYLSPLSSSIQQII